MITWKPIKFKHALEAESIERRIKTESESELIMVDFVCSLVADWDFVDAETGEPIPPGSPNELTLPQLRGLVADFRSHMQGKNVPKPPASS